MDFSKFQKPDTILRPAPFWAINDKITPQETARQIRDLIRVGFSGGFFHSRAGLITDYLGDQWFNSIKAAIDVAKKEDGYVWLYDEDLWPSGNAGGRISAINDEYRAAVLQPEFVSKGAKSLPDGEDEPKAAYVLNGRKGAAVECIKKVNFDDARNMIDSERLLFRRHYAEKTAWWGGESPSNLLNPDVTKEFIKHTHEVYKQKLGDEFAKRIPGIFTDEPNIFTNWCQESAIAWWSGIPEKYSEWNDRDFWEDLPYLYLDGIESRKIRLFIHRTIARQFCEAYSKQLYEWCDKNGIPLTGHFLEESSFIWQINATSGSIMVHYRYEHIPGIDHLCRNLTNPLQPKQVGSAARQLGKNKVLVEDFGASRHTNTFEDFKWISDNDLALGATFFCPHLCLYSIKGRRKRDYPPNWNYQQTYWNELNALNDYLTRVGYVMSSGKGVPDVLLLHPIEGSTADHRYGLLPMRKAENSSSEFIPTDLPSEDITLVNMCDAAFNKIFTGILNAGYDCDLGDETFIGEIGAVDGKSFIIGEMSYPIVVVPPSKTWRPKTFEMLMKFASNGGKLIILGSVPSELDCEYASEEWNKLISLPSVELLPEGARNVVELLDCVTNKGYTLRDDEGNPIKGLYLQHRRDADIDFYFIVNSDYGCSHKCVFTIYGPTKQPLAVWNPVDGTSSEISPKTVGKGRRFSFTLPSAGSILIVAGCGDESSSGELQALPTNEPDCIIPIENSWNFSRSEENVLVLDRLTVSLDNGQTWWKEDMDFRIRGKLAEHFGTKDALTWQPWVAIRKGLFDGKGGDIILRYRFTSTLDAVDSAYLVVEDMKKGRVFVNGIEADISSADWHWDKSFGKINIASLIEKGENTVDFKLKYDFLSEVEPTYIVGDFGVALSDPCSAEIVEEPSKLTNGSWVKQGYPFYPGSIIYKNSFNLSSDYNKVFLRLIHASGMLYKVKINSEDAGKILWRPHMLDITEYVKLGINDIEITVVSSQQNALGPLHEKDNDQIVAAPDNFENDLIVRPEFSLYNYGLLGGAEIVLYGG